MADLNMEWLCGIGALLASGLIWKGRGSQTEVATLVAPANEESPSKDLVTSRKIYLNDTTEHQKPDLTAINNLTILGAQPENEDELLTRALTDNKTMVVKAHGAYIIFDKVGNIVKTRDALSVVREYMRDPETNLLMVRRFGVWTTPPKARLDKDGVLYWSDDKNEFEEHLDGKHVQINTETGTIITADKLNNTETVSRRCGESWKQTTREDGEELEIWNADKLAFRSFSYKDGGQREAVTLEGNLTLRNVYRHEAHFANGEMVSESFVFNKPGTKGKSARMRLELPTGALFLKCLAAIECKYENGIGVSTTYVLEKPTAFTIDIPKQKATVYDIVKVNSTFISGHNALVLVTKDNDEYVVFPGPANDAKAVEVFSLIRKSQECGGEIPDLLLR